MHSRFDLFQRRCFLSTQVDHPRKQRLCCCHVFLDDEAVVASAEKRRLNGTYGSKPGGDILTIQGALSESQLQDAVSQVLGAHRGFRVEEQEQQDVDEASDVWRTDIDDYSEDRNYNYSSDFSGDILSPTSNGRADSRALKAIGKWRNKSEVSASPILPNRELTAESNAPHSPEESSGNSLSPEALLPEIPHPAECNAHRFSNDTTDFMEPISSTSKFLERYMIFGKQLVNWGYQETRGGIMSPKRTFNNFARANPDLLYMLPVRELHIFVKKFKNFPSRSLDRKYRAASARLCNVYTDFQLQATFNGNAGFQDVMRLILYVGSSDFGEIETKAPGIVAAASELLPEILVAATQPPQPEARQDHTSQWRDIRDSDLGSRVVRSNGARPQKKSRKGRRRQGRSEGTESGVEDAEKRLESIEEKLAATLRSGSWKR